MARLSPHFPLAHGVPRVDDRRVVSGIVYVIRNGLQWKGRACGLWSPQDALQPLHTVEPARRVRSHLRLPRRRRFTTRTHHDRCYASEGAPHLGEACSKRGCSPSYRPNQGWTELQTPCGLRPGGTSPRDDALRRADERPQGGSPHAGRSSGRRGLAGRQGIRQQRFPSGSGRARHHTLHSVEPQPQDPSFPTMPSSTDSATASSACSAG